MADDNMIPIRDSITKSVAREKTMNSDRLKDIETEKRRRSVERQREAAELAKIKDAERGQVNESSRKESASEDVLRQEGNVLRLSEGIQKDYIDEVARREVAERKLKEQSAALDRELQKIAAARG